MKHYRFTRAIQVSDAVRKDLLDPTGKPLLGPRKFAAGQIMAEEEVSAGCLETLKRTGRVVELTPEEVAQHEANQKAVAANTTIHGKEQAPAPPAAEPEGKAKKK